MAVVGRANVESELQPTVDIIDAGSREAHHLRQLREFGFATGPGKDGHAFAGRADAVAVTVELVRVRDPRAVVLVREDPVLVRVALAHSTLAVVIPPVRVGVAVIAVPDAQHLRTRGVAEATRHTTRAGKPFTVAVVVVVGTEVLAHVADAVAVDIGLVGVGDADAVVAAVQDSVVVVVRVLVVVPSVGAGVDGVGVAVAVAIAPGFSNPVHEDADITVMIVDARAGGLALGRGVPGADDDFLLRGGLDPLLVVDRRRDTEFLVLLAEVTPHEERGHGEEAEADDRGTHGSTLSWVVWADWLPLVDSTLYTVLEYTRCYPPKLAKL